MAEDGINRLKEGVDTLIVIPNDRLLQVVDKKASIQQAFRVADDVLRQGIQGISELITIPGLINLDFADVRSVMEEGGSALMAIGQSNGDNRAQQAAEQAIHSSLLDVSIDGAQGILFNITGGPDLSLYEVNEAAEIIRRTADPDANIIFGAVDGPGHEGRHPHHRDRDRLRSGQRATGAGRAKRARPWNFRSAPTIGTIWTSRHSCAAQPDNNATSHHRSKRSPASGARSRCEAISHRTCRPVRGPQFPRLRIRP